MPGVGGDAQMVPAAPPLGVGLVSTCTWAVQSQATAARGGVTAWEIFLSSVPFFFLRADTQTLSQVRKHPEHRPIDMFLETQSQGWCFHGEESKGEKAPNNYRAGSENEPLSVWTQGPAGQWDHQEKSKPGTKSLPHKSKCKKININERAVAPKPWATPAAVPKRKDKEALENISPA